MFDVEISLEDRPGELARMGAALARGGISIEGGGVWLTGGRGVGHYLFGNGEAARAALEHAGFRVLGVHAVTVLRLAQGKPGQLGALCREMAAAGINITVQYSDHHNQLVLVTDNPPLAKAVAAQWHSGT